MSFHDDIDQFCRDLLSQIAQVDDEKSLEAVRILAFGKKSLLSHWMKTLATLDAKQKQERGKQLNAARSRLNEAFKHCKEQNNARILERRLKEETVDISLPDRHFSSGKLHPVHQIIDEAIAIFSEMGFQTAEGPHIEDDFHNFTALNIPPDHPARQMQDTFYLPGASQDQPPLLLRTHTSPVQIRSMENQKPPLRIIAPGRTYRSDSDQTHTPMFHQIEGLVVDTETHFGHLKGCLQDFVQAFFEMEGVPVRFRPSHFPFTEPSAEMDISCYRKDGILHIGGDGSEWLEILGCGMVHPQVLENCGLDSTHYQGFAFGMGIERIGMLKYGMPDLRHFFANDLVWLQHYGFSPWEQASLHGGLSFR